MISRAVLSHPSELSEWGRLQIDQTHFRAWLVRSHDSFSEGERFEEFVDTGCCGNTHYIEFVVECVDGDGPVSRETDIEYTERDGCDRGGGWTAQSTVE
ncbi:hypothetical protein [Halocatena pleomorpha]|uniref:DUF7968 domain-containing protein n=1 Tax=Halocatena pleomorpha TaxID=1785090 RepID=A0A3P3R3X1_9EURY|nr:hypothetical protein [Halocatena pleomorpha]RRJ28055.1 hypothetical protein EIK79_16865 [Halocatena pleomorpha]